MGAQEFGQLVRQAMKDKGLSQGRLGYLITKDDGPYFDASAVGTILRGKRVLTRDLVERVIRALQPPQRTEDELWEASGFREDWYTAEHARLIRQFEELDDAAKREVVQTVKKRHLSVARERRTRPVQAADRAAGQRNQQSTYIVGLAGQRHRILRVFPVLALRAA